MINKKLDRAIAELVTEKDDRVKLSFSVSTQNNRRMEYVSKKLKITKQQLLEKLFFGALVDLEGELGLLVTEEQIDPIYKVDQGVVELLTSQPNQAYREIIKSDKSIDLLIREEDIDNE